MNTNGPLISNHTSAPTLSPTASPSFWNASNVKETFIQTWCGTEISSMTELQKTGIGVVLRLSTSNYGPDGGEPIVNTNALVLSEKFDDSPNNKCINQALNIANHDRRSLLKSDKLRFLNNGTEETTPSIAIERKNAEAKELTVFFEMTWSSRYEYLNYSDYISSFIKFANNPSTKNETITSLNGIGVKVQNVTDMEVYEGAPVLLSPSPSIFPSVSISRTPQIQIKENNSTPNDNGTNSSTIIAACVLTASIIAICFLSVMLHRRKKQNLQKQRQSQIVQNITLSPSMMSSSNENNSRLKRDIVIIDNISDFPENSTDLEKEGASSASSSYAMAVSIQDIHSSESHENNHNYEIEEDYSTRGNEEKESNSSLRKIDLFYDESALLNQKVEDELDLYKNTNLERLRAGVQARVVGCENMLSQSFVRALLMDDDDAQVDLVEAGVNTSSNHIQQLSIEANFLCTTINWIKRLQDNISIELRKEFLQKIINETVTCVLYNIVSADKSAQIIHECACLLNLNLKQDLPGTTLIISGMPKNASVKDLKRAFKHLGDPHEIAIGSKNGGFGFARFTSTRSAALVMEKFRKSEIVVQDVAVRIRRLISLPEEIYNSNKANDETVKPHDDELNSSNFKSSSFLRNPKSIDSSRSSEFHDFLERESKSNPTTSELIQHRRVQSNPSLASDSHMLHYLQ